MENEAASGVGRARRGRIVGDPPLDVDDFLAANITMWSWFNAVFAYGFAATIGRQPGPDNLETATWACVEHGSRVTGLELAQAFAVQNAVTLSARGRSR